MKVRTAAVLLVAGALAAMAAALPLTAAPRAKSQPPKPQPSYVAYGCQQCHGFAGQGGSGPPLVPVLAKPVFVERVRRPIANMPAYPQRLLDDRVLDEIYAHVQGFAPAPPLSRVPLLRERMPDGQMR
jgi:mono/diheme cytochrome c family protein